MTSFELEDFDDYLAHHGIKGQKWGIRRYQNPDGSYTEEGKKRYLAGAKEKYRSLADKARSEFQKSKDAIKRLRNTRLLSVAEIMDAEKDLKVDFRKKHLLPVADTGDNDFIVYDYKNKEWAMFNIADEVIFKKRKSLGGLCSNFLPNSRAVDNQALHIMMDESQRTLNQAFSDSIAMMQGHQFMMHQMNDLPTSSIYNMQMAGLLSI